MRAGPLTGRPSHLIGTQVAFGRLVDRLLSMFVDKNRPTVVADLDHVDIVVGATIGTGTATDACKVVDPDDAGLRLATDCTCGTADHADRVRSAYRPAQS